MTRRRKQPDVVCLYFYKLPDTGRKKWEWFRYRNEVSLSSSSQVYSSKKQCLRLARELNPGCKFEIEGEE